MHTVSIVKYKWQSCFKLLFLFFLLTLLVYNLLFIEPCLHLLLPEGPFIKITFVVYDLLGKYETNKEQIRDKVSCFNSSEK